MIRHEIYEKELEKQKQKMAKEAAEEKIRREEERLEEIERQQREQQERESAAAKSRKGKRHNQSQPRNNFRRKSLRSKDTMGMNSPTKGKKKILSDGTSTEQIVISTTKSFQAKMVMNPVNTNVSKQQNQLSGRKSQKKADKSNVDKHNKLGDELFGSGI